MYMTSKEATYACVNEMDLANQNSTLAKEKGE